MGGFKQFIFIVAGLIGIATALILYIPYTDYAEPAAYLASLMRTEWFFYIVSAGTAVLLIAMLYLVLLGIVRRKPKDVTILNQDGSCVTIARSAIASQATYLAENTERVRVEKIKVIIRRHVLVNLKLVLSPQHSLNVVSEAQAIQTRVRDGLTALLGDHVGTITLRFLEPVSTGDITSDTQGQHASIAYKHE